MKGKQPIYFKNQEPPKLDTEFTNPFFPPTANSLLGLDSSGIPIDRISYEEKKGNINPDEICFLRAKEIIGDDYCLFSEKIEMEDVEQGSLGDCYFLTSVSNLCKFPNKLKSMFKQSSKNEKGFYEIEFYIDGKKQIVVIDDYLPVSKVNKQLIYAKSVKKQIYVMLLEKAWAKINGGYINIIGGKTYEALEILTGKGSVLYSLENKEGDELVNIKRKIIKRIQLASKNNCIISCSTKDDENIDKVGLVDGHVYSIIDFIKIETSEGNDVYLFKLRNPWATKEWNGDWSDKSSLWDSKTKSQVQYEDKDDGIFFMNDNDFFKYFREVQLCYLLLDSEEVIYEIVGGEKNKNGIVFNIETGREGYLNISIPKENWRVHRDLRDKNLPTHISIVKYDPSAKNRLKTFSKYNGNYESVNDCSLNLRISKGNYLIYVYRDFDHAEYESEKKILVKITCSEKFKHAQMSYDEIDKRFPLLQNIILQAVFKEYNYDPDSGKDLSAYDNQIKGNGIGYYIKYYSTPGYFYKSEGGIKELNKYIMLNPYHDSKTTTFRKTIPSGKFLVILGIRTSSYGGAFNCMNGYT